MDNLSLLSLINHFMDFLLVAAAIWMAVTVAKFRLGGALSSSVNRMVIGAFILGVAHMVETLSLKYGIEENLNELIHRAIIFFGFVSLILGVQSLARTFGKQSN